MTDTIQLISRAKINWLLSVGPVRADGYHELVTVFQEISLGEPMTFSRNEADACHLQGFPDNIPAESNLVTRAWHLMKKLHPQVGGMNVNITKQLPQGGGLGGGSSNAACTLNAINNLYHLNLSPEKLESIGAQIGSDVAFFIQGKTALAKGRGEILEHLPPAPTYWLVLLMPDEGMSTALGYKLLDETPRVLANSHVVSELLTSLHSSIPELLADHFHNDFELVANKFKWFNIFSQKLVNAGVIKCLLCGSGSTIAGIAIDQQHAEKIASRCGGLVASTTF